eukprot:TRINITY_DN6485_c0_g1_i2.p1 TRINITY_DN6485_c0_g1~~TRINITY_DN6485_c0_g1_i2.p1  ORF type:complete len:437 (+),score=107.68 TRINITY_DN6485_c0_g1_i2:78-1313(+)
MSVPLFFATVGGLKRAIEDAGGPPATRQRLSYHGRELASDEEDVADTGLTAEARIDVTQHLAAVCRSLCVGWSGVSAVLRSGSVCFFRKEQSNVGKKAVSGQLLTPPESDEPRIVGVWDLGGERLMGLLADGRLQNAPAAVCEAVGESRVVDAAVSLVPGSYSMAVALRDGGILRFHMKGKYTPERIEDSWVVLPRLEFTAVAVVQGVSFTGGLSAEGKVRTWSRDPSKKLMNKFCSFTERRPVRMVAGRHFITVQLDDSTLVSWGQDFRHQAAHLGEVVSLTAEDARPIALVKEGETYQLKVVQLPGAPTHAGPYIGGVVWQRFEAAFGGRRPRQVCVGTTQKQRKIVVLGMEDGTALCWYLSDNWRDLYPGYGGYRDASVQQCIDSPGTVYREGFLGELRLGGGSVYYP